MAHEAGSTQFDIVTHGNLAEELCSVLSSTANDSTSLASVTKALAFYVAYRTNTCSPTVGAGLAAAWAEAARASDSLLPGLLRRMLEYGTATSRFGGVSRAGLRGLSSGSAAAEAALDSVTSNVAIAPHLLRHASVMAPSPSAAAQLLLPALSATLLLDDLSCPPPHDLFTSARGEIDGRLWKASRSSELACSPAFKQALLRHLAAHPAAAELWLGDDVGLVLPTVSDEHVAFAARQLRAWAEGSSPRLSTHPSFASFLAALVTQQLLATQPRASPAQASLAGLWTSLAHDKARLRQLTSQLLPRCLPVLLICSSTGTGPG